MNGTTVVALSPETVLSEMKKNGVTHVVWLPDSETNWLYLLMKAEPSLRLVGVSREGHACSIAAGLSVAGAKPLILIQNTGMMESGDSLRGWLLGLNIPVVLMVGYRGWTRHGGDDGARAKQRDRLDTHVAIRMSARTRTPDVPPSRPGGFRIVSRCSSMNSPDRVRVARDERRRDELCGTARRANFSLLSRIARGRLKTRAPSRSAASSRYVE